MGLVIYHSSDINYERTCVFFNLAVLYYKKAELLFSVISIDFTSMLQKKADFSSVIAHGKQCVSIMRYIRLVLLPFLNPTSLPWDLSQDGFYAVCYFF